MCSKPYPTIRQCTVVQNQIFESMAGMCKKNSNITSGYRSCAIVLAIGLRAVSRPYYHPGHVPRRTQWAARDESLGCPASLRLGRGRSHKQARRRQSLSRCPHPQRVTQVRAATVEWLGQHVRAKLWDGMIAPSSCPWLLSTIIISGQQCNLLFRA